MFIRDAMKTEHNINGVLGRPYAVEQYTEYARISATHYSLLFHGIFWKFTLWDGRSRRVTSRGLFPLEAARSNLHMIFRSRTEIMKVWSNENWGDDFFYGTSCILLNITFISWSDQISSFVGLYKTPEKSFRKFCHISFVQNTTMVPPSITLSHRHHNQPGLLSGKKK